MSESPREGKQNLLLRQARREHGLSQSQVADKVGVDERTYRRWENEGQIPGWYAQRKLLTLFGKATPDALGFGERTRRTLSSPQSIQQAAQEEAGQMSSSLSEPSPDGQNLPVSIPLVIEPQEPIPDGQYISSPPSPISSIQQQSRARLLKQIRTIWIKGFLEDSLHQAAWISLHFQEQPDALENPWRFQLQELGQAPRALPVKTSIVEVYDEADGELLILGEPGSGKTTLLLQLAQTLLDRAEADERHCLPVVFHLSSWAQKQETLATWLVEELKTKYQVPRQIGQHWIEASQVLPLLDGLDEVADSARVACVQAITAYYHQHLPTGAPLVISCRSEEYRVLSLHLPLQRAVSILPLTREQIDAYLSSAQGQLEGLRRTLQDDAELYALARRPLMLSIFTLAYQGVNSVHLPTESAQGQTLHAVFHRYVQCMLLRRGLLPSWMQAQFLPWLIFVARQLRQQQQSMFSVEDLQPDWLGDQHQRWYQWSVRLLFGLVGWLLFGLGSGLAAALGNGLLFGLGVGLIFGPFGGILFGLGFRVGNRIHLAEIITWTWNDARRRLLVGAIVGTLFGLAVGVPFGLLFELGAGPGAGPGAGLGAGLLVGLSTGLVFGPVGALSKMRLIERSHFAPNEGVWRSAKNGLVVGLLSGPVLGLISGLFGWLFFGRGGPVVRPLGGLALGLAIGLVGVISTMQWTERGHFVPKDRVWRTVKTSLVVGLLGGLAVALLFVLGLRTSHGFVGEPGIILGYGLVGILVFGLSGALIFGLSSFVQHFLLRFFLWRTNCLPWKLVPFLDEAAKRLLLRKVGSSYIFVHRLLLEYLATLGASVSAEHTSSAGKSDTGP